MSWQVCIFKAKYFVCLKKQHFQLLVQQSLEFPVETPISEEAKNLIQQLCCHHEDRLGKESIDEIKRHPFFRNVDWLTFR